MLPTALRGARTHNLRGVDVDIRPGEVVVITGVSGSGKSSLAVDTLYAEGQRRFVESFSPYARQFLERLERPPMDRLEPVPAGIAVDRRAPVKSSRSTVATMADLGPYLSALFTREAAPFCPEHEVAAVEVDAQAAAGAAAEFSKKAKKRADKLYLTYPIRLDDGDTDGYLVVREVLAKDGYRRLLMKGEPRDIDGVKPTEALRANDGIIDVIVDRFTIGSSKAIDEKRLAAGIEDAWRRGHQLAHLTVDAERHRLRAGLNCPTCARPFEPPMAGLFSYDSPLGACDNCRGFGRVIGIDLEKVIPDHSKTIAKGAIRAFSGKSATWERGQIKKLCERHGVPTDVPWAKLTREQKRVLVEGDGSWRKGKFPGIAGWFEWLETRTYKMHVRVFLARYRSYDACPVCHGQRLNEASLRYRVGGRNLAEWNGLEVRDAVRALESLKTSTGQGELARTELSSRLSYLDRVGLGYLTLDRQARTLSGGEAQRVTLTAALGTSLHNALFVLDEPTVGLHPTDIEPLSTMIHELASRGSAVLVVEHDPAVIRTADRVLEMGPGAGIEGGRLVGDGTPAALAKTGGATARALTAASRAGRVPRKATGTLRVVGATANNLDDVDAYIPLGVLCAVTGPSGSGKSTLAVDIVYRALARATGNFDVGMPGAHRKLSGHEAVSRVNLVDQSPLGRTSRGNAATYTKAWDTVRKRFAGVAEAQAHGLTPSHFSFNVDGGRCDACSGEGWETVEMQFLADVHLVCAVCKGKRFKEEVLRVTYRGVTVADLLDATVDETLALFSDEAAVNRSLGPLTRLGLGYLRLGQPLTTLSGGEAQRLKLARALSEKHEGALLILDEPSAGLHADEVAKLLDALDLIVDAGGSVVVVEHDLDVISAADYVVDLGPDAGAKGGKIVATGTPAEIAKTATRTGRALADRLGGTRGNGHGSNRVSAKSPKVGGKKTRSAAHAPEVTPRRTSNGAAKKNENGAANLGATLDVTRAREHNLDEISVSIPHGALTVVTGPSGSGKSTLAFDVVFAEGQRRFLETLTPYARQFLPTMPRPDVDAVTGVPPSIALEQRSTRAGPKSTVATVTEVSHYLRLLYAKLGLAHCPDHGEPCEVTNADAVFRTLRRVRGKHQLLAPVVKARKGKYLDVFTAAARAGIGLAIADGVLVGTDNPPRLAKTKEHTIDLVIGDPIEPKKLDRAVFDRAIRWGNGAVKLRLVAKGKASEQLFSTRGSCPKCDFSAPDLDPRWFSFNTAQGRCATCEGNGIIEENPKTTLYKIRGRRRRRRRKVKTNEYVPCPECDGARLAPIPRAVRFEGMSYPELTQRSVAAALAALVKWKFSGDRALVAGPVVGELRRRLEFLERVGLDYLSLDRAARTLSGGEMQRLRLAAQLGAGLTGALYVLDEPTIGLHPSDTGRLLDNLRQLVAIGSTVVVVEHDADTIRAADHLVDLGPGGGSSGGRVMAEGPPKRVLATTVSPTARAFCQPPIVRTPLPTKKGAECLSLLGAGENNLDDVDIEIPIGRFTVVAGVSGSGKSTLVRQVLLPALRKKLDLVADEPGVHRQIRGHRALERAVSVDQSPIGRTPRSVPATFLGIWDQIRKLYAITPDAMVAGFAASRFSFNTAGGRCEACDGQGSITHEMSFLPDVVTECPTCGGKRFEPRTLDVKYAGLSIGDVLQLTASEAADIFKNHPKIARPLDTLVDLGAGYIALGQGSNTLSGGEAQRLKLAAELTATVRHEPTLYVLDEPTTGLHLADVSRLMEVLGRLVERGDTLVVIEHHPLVIAGADHVIELGPGGGERGGKVVAAGSARSVAKKKTATAKVLREVFAEVDGPSARRKPRVRA